MLGLPLSPPGKSADRDCSLKVERHDADCYGAGSTPASPKAERQRRTKWVQEQDLFVIR